MGLAGSISARGLEVRASLGKPEHEVGRFAGGVAGTVNPWRPPTASTASAAVTTTRLRTTPRPVAIGTVTNSLASSGSAPGRIPIVVAPTENAPWLAARSTCRMTHRSCVNWSRGVSSTSDRLGKGAVSPACTGPAVRFAARPV